ncbi:MAG: F0F1 ATP synthase subunit B [Cyanobium sp.]|nr:F0F1 ATP synthase subunit B [Cyanobacteriota bacterium]
MTIPLLATHGGFGLNLNPFETNIINLAVVIAGLVYFLRGFLGGLLERRRSAILSDLQDAEQRLADATAALDNAQAELADARARAERIRSDAQTRSLAIRQDGELRTVEEMARLKQSSSADLAAEASRVSKVLQRETARLAIEKALGSIQGKLDGKLQAQLIDQSIKSLGAH